MARSGLSVFVPSKDAKYAVYGISHSGSDWQEYKVMELATQDDARRHDRVGQGVGRGLARRRLLLQPVSCAAAGSGEGVDQREPPGVLPPDRHVTVATIGWSTRTPPIRSGFTRSRRPRTNASRSSPSPSAARARTATRSTCAISRRARGTSRRSSRPSPTIRSASSTTSATRCSCRRIAARRTGASCSSIPPARRKPTGRMSCPNAPSRFRAPARPAASCSRPTSKDVTTRAYVHATGRHVRERSGAAGAWRGGRLRRLARRHVRVLHVQLAQRAADHLQVRHRDPHERRLPAVERAGLRPGGVRHDAGVLHEQGRHARADVPGPPQGPAARRQQPDAALRLRRLQRRALADLQRGPPGDSRARGRLCVGEPARRRRVRRVVAPAGHEAAQAERLRRLHRRGRVAHRQQATRRRRGWRFRADRTAGCSSAR